MPKVAKISLWRERVEYLDAGRVIAPHDHGNLAVRIANRTALRLATLRQPLKRGEVPIYLAARDA
jgi:hypothetical protein